MASLKICACSNDADAVKVLEVLRQQGIPENKIKIRKGYTRISISKDFPQQLLWDGVPNSVIIEVEN